MKIDPVNEYRVEIELADSEMEELGISYDALDWGDIETRRAIWNILNTVRENGVDITLSGKVLIEAGKLKNGCRLCVTVLPPRGDSAPVKSLVKGTDPVFLWSGEKKNVLRAASFFKNASADCFERRGRFVLAVSGEFTEDELLRAGEYCQFFRDQSRLAKAYLEEYFRKSPLKRGT